MNYLSGAFRYVAGSESEPQNVVPRLIDRIKTSALPHDRRSAISQLADAAKTSPERQVQVGELGLKVIYAVLEQDGDYDDTVKATLDLLIAICGTLEPPSDLLTKQSQMAATHQTQALNASLEFERATAKAASTNIDVFLGLPNALPLILHSLEKDDFYIKFGSIELLTAMAANSRQTLQMAILEAAQGVSRICDLLDDSQSAIRSNAVLLLTAICDQSPEICKIVVFGGVLEKLFGLIESVAAALSSVAELSQDNMDEDGDLEGAILIQDVLRAVRNLIRGANTTKTFMRDSGCLPRLVSVIQRAARDSGAIAANGMKPAPPKAVGAIEAVRTHARKNLTTAMNCVTALVADADEETRLVKNDLCTSNLLKTLASLSLPASAYAASSSPKLDKDLNVRVSALKTMSALVRGHDEFRASLNSASYSVTSENDPTSMQVAAMNTMLRDPSAAIRLTAYSLLRESFVVDAGLDLPSSALLNAMTGSAGPGTYSLAESRNASRNSLSSNNDLTSPSNSVIYIAETLKEALVSSSTSGDAAGAFYAASLIAWVVDKVKGARERLLGSYVNGGALLPQIMRVIAKLEREKGPPEVRISLFSLACVWLHDSPSAVSAFLSSAMHLPMLVDILNSSGSRGDIAEVHTRGMAAVVLGICLQASEGSTDSSSDGGFFAGGGGSSIVIPRGAVADVIRSRIGLTVFTACLDDLRATKAFTEYTTSSDVYKLADGLTSLEERNGFLTSNGSLGHENWYGENLVRVVDHVYKNIREKALDLVVESQPLSHGAAKDGNRSPTMNGHASGVDRSLGEERSVLADSARDEVLKSYKEFIRNQDENLSSARRQIDELTAALRQAQFELDTKGATMSSARESDLVRQMQTDKENLLRQKEDLEVLLQEKTADFSALSEAFAALEEDHAASGGDSRAEGHEALVANLQDLQTKYGALKNSYDTEVQKNSELDSLNSQLNEIVRVKDVEVNSLVSERDAMASSVRPEVVEALQWRTRAEVAESKMLSRQSMIDSYQASNSSLQEQLRGMARSQNEDQVVLNALKQRLEETRGELETLRTTRKRELQVSREASAVSNAATKNEIASLRQQLAETQQKLLTESAARASGPAPEDLQRFEQLQSDYGALVKSFEQMKTDLLDTKQAVAQWQRRTEASEAARERQALECNRLTDYSRSMESRMKALNDALEEKTQSSQASVTRVSELEQQCKEIDEIRLRTEEESNLLKEQLASRTEQSIRLSGQLYEIEESKAKLEEYIQTLKRELTKSHEGLEQSAEGRGNPKVDGPADELRTKVAALQEELEVTRDALADSKDRENLSQAQARDRDAAVAKASALETDLEHMRSEKVQLEEEMNELSEKLLSLDEAEEAKRSLTMQVVSLQKALESPEHRNGNVPDGDNSSGGSDGVKTLEEKVEKLQLLSDEKDMRLQELESSLTLALDRSGSLERENSDLEKQVAETEAMLSVLQSERDALITEAEELKKRTEERLPNESETQHVRQLESKLEHAEQLRAASSAELSSLVAACKESEKEVVKMKDDSRRLQERLTASDDQVSVLRKQCNYLRLSHDVETVVNSIILKASQSAQSSVQETALKKMRLSRDQALASQIKLRSEVDRIALELEGLRLIAKERDEAVARGDEYHQNITQLSEELAGLQLIASERDKLASALNATKQEVEALGHEKASLQTILAEMNSRTDANDNDDLAEAQSGQTDPSEASAAHKRTSELEEALRDAAKTVSATNRELLAAQALLVELSSDKTAMRTELASAQQEIEELTKQISKVSRSPPPAPALSELSEQEPNINDIPAVSSAPEEAQETAEQRLKNAHVEASNLRIALKRSMDEAEAAAELCMSVQSRVEDVEGRLKEARSAVVTSKQAEQALNAELEVLKESRSRERISLLQDVNSYKSEAEKLHHCLSQTQKDWSEKLALAEQSWSTERDGLKYTLTDVNNKLNSTTQECAQLREDLNNTSSQLKETSELVKELGDCKQELSVHVKMLETKYSRAADALEMSKARETDLHQSLGEAGENLNSAKETFEKAKEEADERHRREIEDVETEIDRVSSAMEEAERRFRNTESSLKAKLTAQRAATSDAEENLLRHKDMLTSTESQLEDVRTAKEKVEAALAESVQNHQLESASLKTEAEQAGLSLDATRRHCSELRDHLEEARSQLEKLGKDLVEATEQRKMLESENQDFLASVESLEHAAKRTRSELGQKTRELTDTRDEVCQLQTVLTDKNGELMSLEKDVVDKDEEIRGLREAKSKLEERRDELQVSLSNAEATRDAIERDNKDLRAWVADLERQATELQSAATDFEEVEQSLRETLESQRYAADQNAKLVEELRNEKEALSAAEALLRQTAREKEAAESARDSSQRRAQELQSRIRGIREENLVKFSNAEDASRAKAKQCAELETALAASERKVAELESVSDDLFGASTALTQRDEDIKSLRARTESAEKRVEELQQELRNAQSEVSEIRETSSGDAFRTLESEHNELLVYLADLELEVTTLREELGRE